MGIRDWQKVIAIVVLLAFIGMGAAWARTGRASISGKRRRADRQETQKVPLAAGHPGRRRRGGPGRAADQGKKQTLTVNLGVGTSGTPAATAKYKKGTAVSYNYTPKAGFGNLQVRLDGAVVPARGTVTMDSDHTLDVSAQRAVHPDGQPRRRRQRHAGDHGQLSPGQGRPLQLQRPGRLTAACRSGSTTSWSPPAAR